MRVHSSGLHHLRHLLVAGQLLDRIFAADDVLEQFGKVICSILYSLIIRVEVFWLEGGDWRPFMKGQSCLSFLESCFGHAQKVFHIANVTKVGPVACPSEDVNGDVFGRICGIKILVCKLPIQRLAQFGIGVILKVERIFYGKSPCESRVNVLMRVAC